MKIRLLLIVFILPLSLFAQPGSTDIVLLDLEWNQHGRLDLKNPVWVTSRDGYDNQPHFTPDGSSILYTSIRESQADIYRFDLTTKETLQMTETAESEYSPVVMSDGAHFSAVVVEEKDSAQRLWRYPLEGGKSKLIMDAVDPVGYYAWMGEQHVAMFILGEEKNHMAVCHKRKQHLKVISFDIGRCVQPVPGEESASFTVPMNKSRVIRKYEQESGRVSDVCKTIPESEDYCWTPDGKIMMGSGSRLYFFDTKGDNRWHLGFELKDLGIEAFNRIAVSPDGGRIALVVPH